MPYPPTVLMRSRNVSAAVAAALPITVPAGTVLPVTLPFSNCIANAANPVPANTRIRLRLLGIKLAVSAGGEKFIALQNANLQSLSGLFSRPASSGSPLGLVHGASLQAELVFDSSDPGAAAAASASVVLLVQNTDIADRTITAFSGVIEVVLEQYAEPLKGDVG